MEGAGWVVREGVGRGGRNDPNIVCTYELKKKMGSLMAVSSVLGNLNIMFHVAHFVWESRENDKSGPLVC
jgi:hypothetical protein